MKSDKRISVCIVMIVIMLCLTGCGSELIAYLKREKPDKAMERHLEEKYGDNTKENTNISELWYFTGRRKK